MSKQVNKKHKSLISSLGLNLLLMVLVLIALVVGTSIWLKTYTRHGEEVVIPELRGQGLGEAKASLEAAGLTYEVIDSVYRRGATPGTIQETLPTSGARVKPGRIIYLTIFASADRPMTMPMVSNMSARNAMALLKGMGFEYIQVREVAGEYKDLCLGVLNDAGVELQPGHRVSRNTRLTLLVSSLKLDTLRMSDLIEESIGTIVDDMASSPTTPQPDTIPQKEPEDWW